MRRVGDCSLYCSSCSQDRFIIVGLFFVMTDPPILACALAIDTTISIAMENGNANAIERFFLNVVTLVTGWAGVWRGWVRVVARRSFVTMSAAVDRGHRVGGVAARRWCETMSAAVGRGYRFGWGRARHAGRV